MGCNRMLTVNNVSNNTGNNHIKRKAVCLQPLLLISQQRQQLQHPRKWMHLSHERLILILQRLIVLLIIIGYVGPCKRENGIQIMVHAGWVDPDTPEQYYTTQPLTSDDHREYQLVCIN
jgi:hypothetical protein